MAEDLEYAKSLGDLSENAEYHEAREAQAKVEDRISKLENILKVVEIVKNHPSGDVVTVGSTIVVKHNGEKETLIYTIVGSEESDMKSGKISVKSPFGQAAMGKKKKEEFSFSTPKGKMKYMVVDIK